MFWALEHTARSAGCTAAKRREDTEIVQLECIEFVTLTTVSISLGRILNSHLKSIDCQYIPRVRRCGMTLSLSRRRDVISSGCTLHISVARSARSWFLQVGLPKRRFCFRFYLFHLPCLNQTRCFLNQICIFRIQRSSYAQFSILGTVFTSAWLIGL